MLPLVLFSAVFHLTFHHNSTISDQYATRLVLNSTYKYDSFLGALSICDKSMTPKQLEKIQLQKFNLIKIDPGIPGFMILNPKKPGWAKIGKNAGPRRNQNSCHKVKSVVIV